MCVLGQGNGAIPTPGELAADAPGAAGRAGAAGRGPGVPARGHVAQVSSGLTANVVFKIC